MNKNKILVIVASLLLVTAVALGFAAAFTDVMAVEIKGHKMPGQSLGDSYKELDTLPDAASTLKSHISMAYLGGIVGGSLSLVGLGVVGFFGFKAFKGDDVNFAVLLGLVGLGAVMLIVTAIALAFNQDMSSMEWLLENAKEVMGKN